MDLADFCWSLYIIPCDRGWNHDTIFGYNYMCHGFQKSTKAHSFESKKDDDIYTYMYVLNYDRFNSKHVHVIGARKSDFCWTAKGKKRATDQTTERSYCKEKDGKGT